MGVGGRGLFAGRRSGYVCPMTPSGSRALAGLLVFLAVGLAGGPAPGQSGLQTFERDRLEIETAAGGRHAFDIELAVTKSQKSQGLMFRRSLPADAGMLFLYEPEQVVGMWMRNTYIPLDMLFITADGAIAKIAQRAVPESLRTISSETPVSAVLELNAGMAQKLGLRTGDRVLHPAFGTRP